MLDHMQQSCRTCRADHLAPSACVNAPGAGGAAGGDRALGGGLPAAEGQPASHAARDGGLRCLACRTGRGTDAYKVLRYHASNSCLCGKGYHPSCQAAESNQKWPHMQHQSCEQLAQGQHHRPASVLLGLRSSATVSLCQCGSWACAAGRQADLGRQRR